MIDEELFPDDVEEGVSVCWRDAARACGEDCTAFDDRFEEDPRFRPCLLLNIQRQSSKSYSIIAQELRRLNDAGDKVDSAASEALAKRREADAYADYIKENSPLPPEIK